MLSTLVPYAERRLIREEENIIIPGNLKSLSKNRSLLLLAALNLLYGGLHATWWDGHFPTYIKQMMWRVSVCVPSSWRRFNCSRVELSENMGSNENTWGGERERTIKDHAPSTQDVLFCLP